MPINNNQSISDPLSFEERQDFSGGQRYSNDDGKIGGNNQKYNQNMDFDGIDGLVTRVGSLELAELSLAGGIPTLAHLWDAAHPKLLCFHDGGVDEWNGVSLAGLSGYTTLGDVAAVRAGDKVYAVDGEQEMYYYDGSSWAANEAPDVNPAPSGCSLIASVQAGARIALTGKGDEPGRIFYSDIHLNSLPEFDQTTWSLDNGNDGLPNTAQAGWYEYYHVVWKRNKTTVIDCVPTADNASAFLINNVSKTIGCVAPRSVAQVKSRQMFFLAEDGVRILYPTESVVGFDISEPITDMIRDWWIRVNVNYLHTAHAVYRGSKYILWVPIDGATQPTHAFVWDTRLNEGSGGWLGVWKGWGAVDMIAADMDGVTKLYYLSSTGELCEWLDYLDEDSVGSAQMLDYGNNIESVSESGGFTLQERFNDKRFSGGELIYRLDNTEDSATIGASVQSGGYSDIATIEPAVGFSLPFDLPFDLPGSDNSTRPFSMISLDEGRYETIKVTAPSGRLRLCSLWAAGFVKQLRKDNSN